MQCRLGHLWSWPRRRRDVDVQICTRCGTERKSNIQFVPAPDPPAVGGGIGERVLKLLRRRPAA